MSGCEAEGLFVGGLDFRADRPAGFPWNVMLDKSFLSE
jgi:hypothetical protein